MRTISTAARACLSGAAAVVLLLAPGCTPEARKSEPLVGPIDLSNEELRGREHFMKHCHECHPGGEAGLGPALKEKELHAPEIRAQVRNGFGEMPPFDEAKVSDPELDAIIAYLEALREHAD